MAIEPKEIKSPSFVQASLLKKGRASFRLSVGATALLIFLCLNFCMTQSRSVALAVASEDYLDKNDIWWAFNNYQDLGKEPKIFFSALRQSKRLS